MGRQPTRPPPLCRVFAAWADDSSLGNAGPRAGEEVAEAHRGVDPFTALWRSKAVRTVKDVAQVRLP